MFLKLKYLPYNPYSHRKYEIFIGANPSFITCITPSNHMAFNYKGREVERGAMDGEGNSIQRT
jgi:hypothetical protein